MILHWDEVEATRRERGHIAATWQSLTGSASVTVVAQRIRIEPGKWATPLHLEGSEEEIFVVLDGGGTLELWPSPRTGGDVERHDVRAGTTVARPAATGRAHGLVAGPEGMTLLAYGTRDHGDIVYYPRSGKIGIYGVGVIGRIEQLDYWDGER